jgi:hypothetical protein
MIELILEEWAYRVDSGIPNPKNPQHINDLAIVLDELGLSDIKNELITNLLKEEDDKQFKNPALNKVIKYKTVNGKDAEGKVGNLLRRPKEEDAYKKALSTLGGEDSDTYKKAMMDLGGENQPNRDIEKEKEKKSDNTFKDDSEPQTGIALSPKTKGGKKYIKQLSPTDPEFPVEDEEEVAATLTSYDSTEAEKISEKTLKAKQAQLTDARRRMEAGNHDDDTKEAYELFEENMNKLLNAKTKEEQIEAIRTLADNGFLKRNGNGRKLYVSNLPLPSKQVTGQDGDKLGTLVNKLAEENEIDIPLRDESADKALADTSGKHNEAGVVALLDPSEQNKNDYDRLKDAYESYGGDEEAAHRQNEEAVKEINVEIEKLFPGGKVKKATQVGGIGPEKLKELGINPKKDPTDVLIEVELPDGTTQYMKVSMKVYADPSNITMKNSGMSDAGSHYLGAPEIDEQLAALREKHNYQESGISPQEVEKRKREFRVDYLTLFSQKMEELSKTPEGQEKLMEMWKEVHGCGNDVYTSITNKKTGETEVHPPDHYCNPERPFKIEYDGVKVVVRMGGENDDAFLELVCKTESTGSPKILFNHKKKKKK